MLRLTRRCTRSEEAADVPGLTWDEARAAFATGVTASILEDGAEEGEAAICVSVPYEVDDPAKTRDAVSVSFEAGGQEAVYDCFLLTDGANFSIDAADYSEANVGIAGGELVDGSFTAQRMSDMIVEALSIQRGGRASRMDRRWVMIGSMLMYEHLVFR